MYYRLTIAIMIAIRSHQQWMTQMTKFNKDLFVKSGDVTMYDGKFVARFKHVASNRAGFLKFLVANFAVEEYFALLDRDGANLAPVTALETKGYVSAHILKWMKEGKLAEWRGKPASEYLNK